MSQKTFRLPDLGEGLTESEIVTWRVAEGDAVTVNQVLADVETAKAVVEVSSPFAGVIAALHGAEGETLEVGAPLVTFTLEGAEPDVGGPAEGDGRVPTLVGYGAAPDTGKPGRRARRGSATPATSAAPVGEPARADATPGAVRGAASGERPRCTPPVRLYARRAGVDLEQVTGTGAGGVITRADVEAFLAGGGQPAAAATPPQSDAESGSTGGVRTLGGRPRTEAVPVKGVRKATAAAMVQSAFTAPHVTEFLQVDVTETMELLAELKASREFRDVKLTPMTLAAKACLVAMERTPDVNARWDEAAGTIVQQNFVNLGFAAATPRGLMVPNVKDAQAMSLRKLADAIRDLTGLAREGRLSPADLAGGTFTLTNVGVFGVDAGTPIINPGEGAIIAIGQVRRMPWEHRGEIALRDVMTLSLSFDHRFVDGEQGSRFLADVGAILRRPGLTLTMV
ncbi:dihydrolipoamide acetyltransferase family protein [Micrococcus luteus]|uniref:dihydrolipoamide acetyltransferase family protein n=1 Tax=Micrococcus luteus TaxID=1270 RepID=UPI002002D920|nr:dihydrolipoamide acetyltransferase family protein [Micrococcus luteus]MCK6057936.1 2-oxo acid dehydrogenase subunit E2 [Micrococcus luteus]MCK6062461.1 2-oxo acid dehydrogenase subunit E2 [Micrococcus luteus]MCK6064754.1 2-oxo acid dehydrogenase subunit E2 [Micrococcus luteus]MCK6193019.1 2-oxo acid dehydrogenase subunit E2 [Micrococcus luteus]MCK6195189.1 2-oxo acid dehydrogenase subunit E2 [Micrococcus luteus]